MLRAGEVVGVLEVPVLGWVGAMVPPKPQAEELHEVKVGGQPRQLCRSRVFDEATHVVAKVLVPRGDVGCAGDFAESPEKGDPTSCTRKERRRLA